MLTKDDLLRRLKSKTNIINGHWLFEGALDSCGYGSMWDGNTINRAHRLSAYIFLGLDINDKTQHALHKDTCPYRNCWNHDCLYIGTHKDNMKDLRDSLNPNGRLHCGHPDVEANIYLMGGRRRCKICYTKLDRRRRAKERMRKNNQKQINQPNKVGTQS